MKQEQAKEMIEEAWNDRALLNLNKEAIQWVIDSLDKGEIRVAEPTGSGWEVNEWIKKAVLLYFPICEMKVTEIGLFEFHDKIPLKSGYRDKGVRVVPPSTARYGSFMEERSVLMGPSYVNIGAYVGSETMVDSFALVGSCAQIGKRVHISAHVTIGGVLEPVQANPVIVEDDAFIGAGSRILEGVYVKKEAVIGAGVTITASTKILDVTEKTPRFMPKGIIPERAVVIPGTYPKFMDDIHVYSVPCAVIIGERKESTDKKTTLNDALREFNVSV